MSKTKSSPRRSAAEGNIFTAVRDQAAGMRETVESIVIAVILAFLFRGFVAEAFVIPTGSMAPTLFGRHKDVTCEKCGHQYRAGASGENADHFPQEYVVATTCPICRYTMTLDLFGDPNQASFTGDRILVSKFSYDLSDPERWDVIVFKFPGNAKQNYIKRLVGLPNEVIRIWRGDVYLTESLFTLGSEFEGELQNGMLSQELRNTFQEHGISLASDTSVLLDTYDDRWLITQDDRDFLIKLKGELLYVYENRFTIARKPPAKLKAMLQLIDDTRFIAEDLVEVQWPSRWQPWSADSSSPASWRKIGEDVNGIEMDASAGDEKWLRYRHLIPMQDDWDEIEQGRKPADLEERRGQLISDFYAYNADTSVGVPPQRDSYNPGDRERGPDADALGLHWVGDLALECDVEVKSDDGDLLLMLVEGGVRYLCRINVADGSAVLSIESPEGPGQFTGSEGVADSRPTASTRVRGGGSYQLRFSNVDDELRLWVDEKPIPFDRPTSYDPDPNSWNPRYSAADPGDLAPAGIGSQGAKLNFKRLRLLRDVYYIATEAGRFSDRGQSTDYDFVQTTPLSPRRIQELFREPEQWDRTALFESRRDVDFPLGEEQFFPLGDNSPQSRDARLWGGDADPHVLRELLTGKALLIYWPHAWKRPLPFLPNFQRMMKYIR